MRNLGLVITAAIVFTSCASADEVTSGTQVAEPIPVDELQFVDDSPPTTAPVTTTAAPATTTTTSTAPETTTAAPATTAATSPALGAELEDDGEISQTDRNRAAAAREHLTAPWFPAVDDSVLSIQYPIDRAFFSDSPGGLPECAAFEAYEVIDQAFTNRRNVEWSDVAQSQTSGYVQADASAADLIEQVLDSGPCFDSHVVASGDVDSGSTSRGPDVDGIANSVVMDFVIQGADLQFVLATTGNRDIHTVLTATRPGTQAAAPDLIDVLEGLASRSNAAAERVAFCTATYQDASPATVINDERCDGFEAHSPELQLIGYRHATTSAAVDVSD